MEKVGNSINDNERFINKPSMNNESLKDISLLEAEDTARYLVGKFKSPGSWEFYCKVAYRLPRPTIDRLVVTAKEKGNNPGALFNFLARKEMNKRK